MAIYQCTRCGYWSRARDAVIEHLSSAHRHERPIVVDDFAVRPEPSHRPAPRELRWLVAFRHDANERLGF